MSRRHTTTFVSGTLALLLAIPALGVAGASAANAAPGDGTLNISLTQVTGTPGFDADDEPGNDSGPDNDIVRTNDTVKYAVSLRFEGEDQSNPRISFTLPQGEELVQLPPFCLPGSSVTPENIGAPEIPVTPTSYLALPTQSVDCLVANQTQGSSFDYDFISKVRPEMPNGAVLGPVTASAVSDQVLIPAVSEPVEHTVSAAARFDVSKRGTAVAENSGPYNQDRELVACAWDSELLCRNVYYALTIAAPSGGKGITPLASPITLTDDLRPESYYGAATWDAAIALAGSESAATEKYAPRFSVCRNVTYSMWTGIPWSSTNSGERTAVSDSGNIACSQPGGVGTPLSIKITDADTTGYHVPDRIPATQAGIDADTGYVISYEIGIQVPYNAVQELGTTGGDGVTKTLEAENVYRDIEMTDIAGSPNTGEREANNNRKSVLSGRNNPGAGPGEFFAKSFSSPVGAKNNTPAPEFSSGTSFYLYEGPPGSDVVRDGDSVVLPGQRVLSNLAFNSGNGVPLSGTEFSRSYVGCDVWDDTQLGLTPGDYAGGIHDLRPSNGDAAWISYFLNGKGAAQPLSELRNLKIEYSSGPFGAGSGSDCSTGAWFASPEDVPGAVIDDEGVFTGVNRVRFSFTSDFTGNGDSFRVNLAIGQTVRDTAGDIGDKIGNYGSKKWLEGVHDMNATLNDPKPFEESAYDPSTHRGSWGDRLTVGGVTARLKKFVKNPGNGEYTDTAVPQYSAGSRIDYRLNPTITADVPAGVTADVVVEDCLPTYQQFVSSARGSGDPIQPVLVQSGSPAGSELSCGLDETYVKWDLGENEVNADLDPINYSVEVLDTARNGTYTNRALVSSSKDPSLASARDDDAQVQLVLPTGIKIAKSTPRSVVEVNPDSVENPRTLQWRVEFANVNSPVNVSNVDVIDVLPANGLGSTAFHGELAFTSASVSAGNGIRTLYSAASPASLSSDPDHPSNGAAGSTVWCDASEGGSMVSGDGTVADCPAHASDVTALRFQRDGNFLNDDQMVVNIVMTPSNNRGGDVYQNTTSGRAQGVTQPVGPAVREVRIIESSIGDYVWEDLNSNGVQDEGEPGIPGFPVLLTGTDLDGNPVSLQATTDDQGKYLFGGLASGTYKVTFDPNGLASNMEFTSQNSGDDPALDSDGDVTTGETRDISLAPDTNDLDWDQGVIIDRSVAVTVDKRVVSRTDIDDDNRTTVDYEIVVANSGKTDSSYDLKDVLQFSDAITIDTVKAKNTAPGDIEVSPEFDGVVHNVLVKDRTIAAGETHRYSVTVGASVKTTITTEENDCTVTTAETGGGFLNSAELTVGTTQVTNKACTPILPPTEVPPKAGDNTPPSGLPLTGGQIAIGSIALAALLVLLGTALVVVRKRRAGTASGE